MPYNMNTDEILEAIGRVTPQWLARFFDGEDSVVAYKNTRTGVHTFAVHLSQKDGKILALIQYLYGGSLYPLSRKGHDWFMLKWEGKTSVKLLESIKDFVICKKRQVEAALSLSQYITAGGSAYSSIVSSEAISKRAEYAKIIIDSNNGIDNDKTALATQQKEVLS